MRNDDDYGYPPRPRRHRTAPAPWLAAFPILIVLTALGFGIYHWGFQAGTRRIPRDTDAQPRSVTPRGEHDAADRHRIEVFKRVSPGVVNVDTLRIQRTGYVGLTERQQGTGSGFMWDEQGRIVTNFHVIRDALAVSRSGTVTIQPNATIRVTLADRTPWNARLVGVAPDVDLAVLQINAPADKVKPLPVGSSSDLEVGETVYAIGNPFGQSLSFTQGIVSALDREIQSATDRPITGIIQTDAALNPGNSGGPLLDRDGRCVGVNTAITSPSGGSVGIGYSIPIDTVNRVVTELIRTGRSARPSLGVVLLRDRDTRALGFEQGVMIAEVRPNSAADKAGLAGFRADPRSGRRELGDLITAINGESVGAVGDFERMMGKFQVQQSVRITIVRDGKSRETDVVLDGI